MNKMPGHVMLSYQWDDQELVKKVCSRLREDGLPVWMDVEGGVTGNINDSMAAAVEQAAVICPFMTSAYQASRSCKKELSYADSREVLVVPVMVARDWEATEWLGLVTAGLLWVDFRSAEEDEEHFEMSLRSLEEEIMFNAGHLLAAEEPPAEAVDGPEPRPESRPESRPGIKKKPGRGFCHALSKLYIHESDEQLLQRSPVELSQTPADGCYWQELKGSGCKYYRSSVSGRYLAFDSCRNQLHSELSPSESAEWLLLVDQTDLSHHRAVVIKNKRSGSFLAVQHGRCVGLTAYSEDCKWLLQ